MRSDGLSLKTEQKLTLRATRKSQVWQEGRFSRSNTIEKLRAMKVTRSHPVQCVACVYMRDTSRMLQKRLSPIAPNQYEASGRRGFILGCNRIRDSIASKRNLTASAAPLTLRARRAYYGSQAPGETLGELKASSGQSLITSRRRTSKSAAVLLAKSENKAE